MLLRQRDAARSAFSAASKEARQWMAMLDKEAAVESFGEAKSAADRRGAGAAVLECRRARGKRTVCRRRSSPRIVLSPVRAGRERATEGVIQSAVETAVLVEPILRADGDHPFGHELIDGQWAPPSERDQVCSQCRAKRRCGHPGYHRMTMRAMPRHPGSPEYRPEARRRDVPGPFRGSALSADPRQRVPDEHVDDPAAAEGSVKEDKSRRFRLNLADDRGVDAKRMAAETRQCIVRRLGRHDGDELPLVRDVERIDPEDLGAPATSGRTGIACSSSLTASPVVAASSFIAVASPPRVGSRIHRSCGPSPASDDGQPVQRRGVALEGALELEVAAGDEHGETVVADRSREEDAVARPAGGRRSPAAARRRRS